MNVSVSLLCDISECYQWNLLSSIWKHKEQVIVCVYLKKGNTSHIKASRDMDLQHLLDFKGVIHTCSCIYTTATIAFMKVEKRGQSNNYHGLTNAESVQTLAYLTVRHVHSSGLKMSLYPLHPLSGHHSTRTGLEAGVGCSLHTRRSAILPTQSPMLLCTTLTPSWQNHAN